MVRENRKYRVGFDSREGVYGNYRLLQRDRASGQLVLKIEMGGKPFRAFPALITFWQRQPELSTAEYEIHCSS